MAALSIDNDLVSHLYKALYYYLDDDVSADIDEEVFDRLESLKNMLASSK